MNKFEQVSSGDQQMALAGGGVRAGGPQSDVRVAGPGEACMVRSNASWVMVIWDPPNRQTRVKNLPSRNLVGGR